MIKRYLLTFRKFKNWCNRKPSVDRGEKTPPCEELHKSNIPFNIHILDDDTACNEKNCPFLKSLEFINLVDSTPYYKKGKSKT